MNLEELGKKVLEWLRDWGLVPPAPTPRPIPVRTNSPRNRR
jgi:hypothetical protein